MIVVDDGSSSATASVLQAQRAPGGLQLRTLRHEAARGPGAARNQGWRQSRAALVAFIDDDCVPCERWLAAGLEAAERFPGSIVQGATEPDPSELGGSTLLSRTVVVRSLGPQYQTCNIFYPRSILEAVGGFDESFGPSDAGEDTDLAWRALERGFTATFTDSAAVLHGVQRLGLIGTLRSASRWTAAVRVFAEHRGTRSMLYRGRFWNVWHYLLLRSAVALIGPRWLRRVLILRHVLELQRRGRDAGAGLWSVPFLVAYDLLEALSIIRGAVRYRTLVL